MTCGKMTAAAAAANHLLGSISQAHSSSIPSRMESAEETAIQSLTQPSPDLLARRQAFVRKQALKSLATLGESRWAKLDTASAALGFERWQLINKLFLSEDNATLHWKDRDKSSVPLRAITAILAQRHPTSSAPSLRHRQWQLVVQSDVRDTLILNTDDERCFEAWRHGLEVLSPLCSGGIDGGAVAGSAQMVASPIP